MNIDVVFLPLEACIFRSKTVIVIDVLRASSSMVTAFSNGCASIQTIGEIDRARKLKAANPELLLCGERQGEKIKGFDLGNSPFEYKEKIVKEKDLILTTTNGTQAIEASREAEKILVGCFLNLDAVVQRAMQFGQDIIVLCSGSDGRFSFEDAFCAGLMLEKFTKLSNSILFEDGARWTSMVTREIVASNSRISMPIIFKIISETRHGRRLHSLNFTKDIEYCARLNLLNIVPRLAGDKFII